MKRNRPFLLLTILSGYFVLLSHSWTITYKANLFFHPIIGLLCVILFFKDLARDFPGKAGEGIWGKVVLPAVLFAVTIGFLRSRYPHDAWDWILVGLFPLVNLRMSRKKPELFFQRWRVFYFTVVVITGAAFAASLGGRDVENLLLLHRASSHAFVFTIILSGLIRGVEALDSGISPALFKRTMKGAVSLGTASVVALFFAATFIEIGQRGPDPYYKFHLSTFSMERRGPLEQDVLPLDFNEPELASKTYSCGTAKGCHQSLIDDLSLSTHGRSMHTLYFQRNMDLLAEEIGEHNQITCGGCHYSRMMFERTKTIHDSYREINYSCTFCHLVDNVKLWDDPRKSDLTVRLHVNHLRMFDHQGGDEIGEFDQLLINLNPYGHARVFKKDLYSEDIYCQVCHRLQIKPTEDTPMSRPKCIDCHMQPRYLLGLPGEEMNHIFPGTNTANPALLGNDVLTRINMEFCSGDLPLPIKGWGSYWEPRDQKSGRMTWVHQKAMPLTEDPVPGEDFTIRIITINASIDHVFPGGPLDLIETWHHVNVRDQEGRVLFSVGDLDENQRIDPDAHRMGGYMIGEDDKLVERNRVWQIKEKVVDRAIHFRHSTNDDYTFRLPENVTDLHVEAYWYYRKLNQEFMDWAYDNSGVTVQPILVSALNTTISLQ